MQESREEWRGSRFLLRRVKRGVGLGTTEVDSGGHIDQVALAVDVFNCFKHASGEEGQQRIAPLHVLEIEEHRCGAAAVERQAHNALALGNAGAVEGHGQ